MLRDERARTYRRRAEEMRHGAESTTEIAAQNVMTRLAMEYDAMASNLELRARRSVERHSEVIDDAAAAAN